MMLLFSWLCLIASACIEDSESVWTTAWLQSSKFFNFTSVAAIAAISVWSDETPSEVLILIIYGLLSELFLFIIVAAPLL